MTRNVTSLVALITALFLANSASAQDGGFQLEHFEPLPNMSANLLNVGRSPVLPHLSLSAGLVFHYSDTPMVVRGETMADVDFVKSRAQGEIWAGIGLFNWLDVGALLPVVFYQDGGDLEEGLLTQGATATVGDVRVVTKFRFLRPEWAAGFGGALMATVWVPTGDQTTLNSDGTFRVEPRLILDWTHPVGFSVAANVGYHVRPERTVLGHVSDDTIRYGAGLLVPTFWQDVKLYGDYFAQLQATGDGPQFGDAPVESAEVLGGIQVQFPDNIAMNLGGGPGLNENVGSPSWRVVAAFGYAPATDDRDFDGIPDDKDSCPDVAEDRDGHDDFDGCPDDDRDGDGIADTDDECPDDREDIDGFKDDDGCPELDNDEDGVADRVDKCPDVHGGANTQDGCPRGDRDGDGVGDDDDSCPDEKEDVDGFDDFDGCPDLDDDFDGIPDTKDRCRLKAEDLDGFQDEDGCPDPDNDNDGINDGVDKCPNEAETFNDFEDEDGCPDQATNRVKVTKDKIIITEKIYFATGSADIQSRSFDVLEEIASAMKANPQIKSLRIEGHTDDRGSDMSNLKLSQRRAKAVRAFLVNEGVEKSRLEAKGFGEEQPVGDNDTAVGRDRNRRVEFHIVR